MKYRFTDSTKVEILVNTTDSRLRIQVCVSRFEQRPETRQDLVKDRCENCTWVQAQDR